MNGWKYICGWQVLVEDGKVVRGISLGGTTVYPYRKIGTGWSKMPPVPVSTFRNGMKKHYISLF